MSSLTISPVSIFTCTFGTQNLVLSMNIRSIYGGCHFGIYWSTISIMLKLNSTTGKFNCFTIYGTDEMSLAKSDTNYFYYSCK